MRVTVTVIVVVLVLVLVAVIMLVCRRVVMFMGMGMSVIVYVIMRVFAVMKALPRAWTARIFAKHQRFDRHRHGVGRHADTAKIDIVKVPEHHAVDEEKIAGDMELIAKEVAERLRYVAV